jgi:tRNA (guanine37-N1)-methyltransferase
VRIDILTLFPPMFDSVFSQSIIGRARERQLIDIRVHNIRDYTHDKHHIVDDSPYGGGAGMVLKPEPVFETVEAVKQDIGDESSHTILLSPQGRLFNQTIAEELSGHRSLLIICGRYEGVDERVAEYLAPDEISIGDYVLSGGEVAAMVLIESIVRLLPGVVGSEESIIEDSHSGGLLEYPQYTRPPSYRGWEVPEILLSGNHAEIARWRRHQRLIRTAKRRPDLLDKAVLSPKEMDMVKEMIHKTE